MVKQLSSPDTRNLILEEVATRTSRHYRSLSIPMPYFPTLSTIYALPATTTRYSCWGFALLSLVGTAYAYDSTVVKV